MITARDRVFYDNYFHIIEPIWKEYFAEKIGMQQRNERLEPYRSRLYAIQLELQKERNASPLA